MKLSIAGWSFPKPTDNVHTSLAKLSESIGAYWYDGPNPRRIWKPEEKDVAKGHNWQKLIKEGKLTVTDWAIDLDEMLKDQNLNGGIGQFMDNYPFYVPEAARMISMFGPPPALEAYMTIARPFIQRLPYFLGLIEAKKLDAFWEERSEYLDYLFENIIDGRSVDLWHDNYLGDGNFWDGGHMFGFPVAGEIWATTITRNLLIHIVENAEDFGIPVERS